MWGKDIIKKSASSHDEAALLGKKYHIAAKVILIAEICKLFACFLICELGKNLNITKTRVLAHNILSKKF